MVAYESKIMKSNLILYTYVYFKNLQFLQQQTLPLLPEAEVQKIQNTQNPNLVLLSMAGKYLLKTGLEYYHMPPSRIKDLQRDKNQRPFLPGCFDFNITHSRNLVACVFSFEGRVGLDIEFVKPRLPRNLSILNPKEQEIIRCSEDKASTFYKFWTRREAVSKADGRGFKLSGKEITFNKNYAFLKGGTLLKLYPLQFNGDYIGTLATGVSVSQNFKVMEVNVETSKVGVLL